MIKRSLELITITQENSPIFTLPLEVLSLILSNSPLRDHQNLQETCSLFNSEVKKIQAAWFNVKKGDLSHFKRKKEAIGYQAEEIQRIEIFLEDQGQNLTSVDFFSYPEEGKVPKPPNQALTFALKCPNAKVLRLGKDLRDEDLKQLMETFKSKLTRLEITASQISVTGLSYFSSFTRLTCIDLTCNKIGDAAAVFFASYSKILTALNLSCNLITTQGFLWLISNPHLKKLSVASNLIALNTTTEANLGFIKDINITDLDMSFNNNTDSCAPFFVSLLFLKKLNLADNLVTAEGLSILLSSPHLTSLNMSANEGLVFDDDAISKLPCRPGLKTLDLSKNKIPPETQEKIRTKLNEINPQLVIVF